MQCQHIGGGVGPAGRAALARQLAWKLPDGPGMVPLDPPNPSPY